MASTMTLTYELTSEELNDSYGNITDYYNFTDDYNFTGDLCENEEVLQGFYALFLPVLYTVIFFLGVAGNGLMITVLVTRWRQLRITEIYLLHLALADLMLLFTIPFDVADSSTGWIFGDFMCKLNEVLKNLNLLCGSVLLACIGFDRYLAIVHAIPSMQSRLPKTVHLTCMILWILCLCLALPNAVFASVVQKNSTTEKTGLPSLTCYHFSYGEHAYNWVLANNVFHHLCFFLSLVIMCYCYTALVITLCNSQKSEAKKGAIRISLLVTLVFCFCWLPFNISLMIYTVRQRELTDEDCKSKAIMLQVLEVTKSLGITHCCLNPFLYAFVGVRFRNEMIHLLCKLGCRRICLPFLRVHGHSRVSISDGATTNSTVLM